MAGAVPTEPARGGSRGGVGIRHERGFGGFALANAVEPREAVDAIPDEAAAAGADVVQPGIDRDWGGYPGYLADPAGHQWEVAWNPDFEIE